MGNNNQYPPLPSLIREGATHVVQPNNLYSPCLSDVMATFLPSLEGRGKKASPFSLHTTLKRTYRPNVLTSYRLKKCAFTLAEVLVTLGIIGVVAAMTMPVLTQNNTEKVTVTRLKKAYSILSQAYTSASSENINITEWGLGEKWSQEGAKNIAEKLIPYLKVTKDCGFEKGCFPANVTYKYFDGTTWYGIDSATRPYKLILADGTLIAIESLGTRGKVFVDINGFKGPNQDGKDLFSFILEKNTVVPFGDPEGKSGVTFGRNQGYTAWVIYNENMDYLRCPEKLGWDKATSCKD